MPRANPNILLVEGDEEKRVIPYLMDEHVVWGDKEDEWVAEIRSYGGIEDLLDPGNIEPAVRVIGRKAVGIVVDADDQFDSRWQRVRNCCLGIAPDFPEDLPPEGLIHENDQGLRIGVWIMPDNQSRGMLETFLRHLIIPAYADLWAFAQESCTRSRDHGAPYTDPHRDKADIHTYLAWLDPPGRSLHVSVLARALDARLPLGEQFARWFIDLYQLTPRPTPLP
jgi:hypothetical protein